MHDNLKMKSPRVINTVSIHTKNTMRYWRKGWHCNSSAFKEGPRKFSVISHGAQNTRKYFLHPFVLLR